LAGDGARLPGRAARAVRRPRRTAAARRGSPAWIPIHRQHHASPQRRALGLSVTAEATTPAAVRSVGPWPAILAGLIASLVGYGSSFVIVLQGLVGVGATPSEAASGLLAVGTAMGLAAIVFALRYRMPI